MAGKNRLGDKLDKDGWPKEVPVLGVRDFCTGQYRKGSQCCLAAWAYLTISPDPNSVKSIKNLGPNMERVVNALEQEIKQHLGHPESVLTFNDHIALHADRPRIWNRAMRQLGYDVPESACK
jgi:hypothetical protein